MIHLRLLLPVILLLFLFGSSSCSSACRHNRKMNGKLLTGTYDFGRSHKYESKNKRALRKSNTCPKWVKR